MSLEKITSSRPFKAMAAFLFGVMILSACQETAQVVNKPISTANPSANLSQKSSVASAESLKLSDEERALGQELLQDKDFQDLNEMRQLLMFKLKIALAHDRNAVKEAILQNDVHSFATLMNFSESEYSEFQTKQKQLSENLFIKLGSKKAILDSYVKRTKGDCQTCSASTKNIDTQLSILENAKIAIVKNKDGKIVTQSWAQRANCSQEVQIKEAVVIAGCFAALGVCLISIPFSFGFGAIACSVGYLSCALIAQCDNCGCPWD